jgi:hypothetical protein
LEDTVPTTARPTILTDPGYIFHAPIGTAEPANTVVGSKFTDAWPVAWISAGATEEGSTFSYTTSVEPVTVAEFFDPIVYATTERSGNIAFNLADWTLTNMKVALNGGTITTTGTTTTTMTKYEPGSPGNEVRKMIGWESLDGTVRIVIRQAINASEVTSAFAKAPALALIPCQFNFEVPLAATPFAIFTAGTARA